MDSHLTAIKRSGQIRLNLFYRKEKDKQKEKISGLCFGKKLKRFIPE